MSAARDARRRSTALSASRYSARARSSSSSLPSTIALVLAEARVHLLGELLESLLAFLAELGTQHLAPQRGEGEGRHGLAAEAAREAIETVGKRGRRIEPAPRLERAEARESVAQAFESVVVDHRLDGLGELGLGEVGHRVVVMDRVGAGCQRWRGRDSPPRGDRDGTRDRARHGSVERHRRSAGPPAGARWPAPRAGRAPGGSAGDARRGAARRAPHRGRTSCPPT